MRRVNRVSAWALMGLVAGVVGVMAYGAKAEEQKDDAVVLAGKTWSGKDSDGDHYVYTFQEDGTLVYKSPGGTFNNGKWHQFGNAVYFQMNDHFSDYLGEITKDKITGKAWNKQDKTWTWEAEPEN